MKKAFVTGSAGFIGFHISKRLLENGWQVLGIDGLTNYYDVSLKEKRNSILKTYKGFSFKKVMLEDSVTLNEILGEYGPDIGFHFAAQAGVRYSLKNPRAYCKTNILGTHNLLEAIKLLNLKHLLVASSSSVYGGNKNVPYKETDNCDKQLSFYAASKKAKEVITHTYSHLYNIPTTCFRFFTVYGPWGRPDMALFKFTKLITEGYPIDIYNNGDMARDFTYIDDLIEALMRLVKCEPTSKKDDLTMHKNDSLSDVAPWRVVNIGSEHPVCLLDFIKTIEKAIGKVAKKNFLVDQIGEVPKTFADNSLLKSITKYEVKTDLDSGIRSFLEWYNEYSLDKQS